LQASGGAPEDEIGSAVVQATTHIVDTERSVSVRLLIAGEEVMTGTMVIEDTSHVLGV